jgi:ribosomal protein S26
VGNPTAKALAVDVAVVEDVAVEVWNVVVAVEAEVVVDLHQAQLLAAARLKLE